MAKGRNMRIRRIKNNIILVIGLLCILYYLAMGIAVRFGQSLLWLWPLVGAVCILHFFIVRRSLRSGNPVPLPKWCILLWRIALAIGFSLFVFVQVSILAAASKTPPDGLDTIIVLGAKVNGTQPSGALNERISSAARYLDENPGTLCIASGGQGQDEGISEAECIRRGLVLRGIDESRILLEDLSTDTTTNFINSFRLLPENAGTVGVVTNDFHVLRALWTARKLSDLQFCGISARSSSGGYVHYCVREFCAIIVGVLTGELKPGSL